MKRETGLVAVMMSAALAWTSIGAQTPPPEQTPARGEQAEAEAASSPHQRSVTKSPTTEEAPTTQATTPDSASSPHQRATRKTDRSSLAERDAWMATCVKQKQEGDAALSKDAAKKACTDLQRETQRPRG